MTLQEKIQFLEEIMEVDEDTLTKDTSLDEIEEWDSLSALVLTTTEMIKGFKTVYDICQCIPD